ncbi:hypothetical protein H0H92_014882 [Tricholoma furcatifolium]|nr:hypothetical protein H0H92_014882 [Tricholoma furcatifolium]
MLKCKELSRLPKAASAKYVNFRRQTPGCISELLKPGSLVDADYLDPSHPAIRTPKSRFPSVRNEALGVKAFPFALLTKPEQIWASPLHLSIETWKERVQKLLSANETRKPGEVSLEVAPIKLPNIKDNAISMSFANATSKKRTSNSRVIRREIAARLKVAINLIVTRDADVAEVNGKQKIVTNETGAKEISDKWIHPGWTYIFFPTLEIYRMPYNEMIPLLRQFLRKIYQDSHNLERTWAYGATIPQKVHPAPLNRQIRAQHAPLNRQVRAQYAPFNRQVPAQNAPLNRQVSAQPAPLNRQVRAQPAHGSLGKATPRKTTSYGPSSHSYRQYSTKRYEISDATKKTHASPSKPKPVKTLPGSERLAELLRNRFPPHMAPTDFAKENEPLTQHHVPPHMTQTAFALADFEKHSTTPQADASGPVQPPVVRLGGVTFKGPPPALPDYRRIARDHAPKDLVRVAPDSDEQYQELKEIKRDVTQIMGQASKLHARKRAREFISKRIQKRESKHREPLGPEFLGFTSQPNPSHDPFTDTLEPSLDTPSKREGLLNLLNKHSARLPPRRMQPPADPPIGRETSLSELSKLLDVDTPSDSDHPDPFALRIRGHDLYASLNHPRRDTRIDIPSDPLAFDPFASDVSVDAPSNSSAPTPSQLHESLQSFDPFPSVPLPSRTPRASSKNHGKVKPADLLRKANAARISRAESAARLMRLAKEMGQSKRVILSWRLIRRMFLRRGRRRSPS